MPFRIAAVQKQPIERANRGLDISIRLADQSR